MAPLTAVLFDVDGTLVDSNDAHAYAWLQAFSDLGVEVAFGAVRQRIGKGGDKLMPEVSGIADDSPHGVAIAARRAEIFRERFLPSLQPFRDAGRLVAAIRARGLTVVAASSATRDELEPLLDIAGAGALMDDTTSSDDAASSKPDPDIVHAALRKAGAEAAGALLIGDTPYDIEAASRAGLRAIAFRCGGWADADLAGAAAIYDGPWDLLARLDDSPLVR
jgi:HAD superfamily hydrolase (TIGR01509 family)